MSKKDPFSKGVWIMTMVGNRDIVAMIDGSDSDDVDVEETERTLKEEMNQHRSVCVTIKKKYVFYQVSFPVKSQGGNGFMPANMPVVAKHEILLELESEFISYANLQWVTFISDLDENNRNKLRVNVNNADEACEMMTRMTKSNIVIPR